MILVFELMDCASCIALIMKKTNPGRKNQALIFLFYPIIKAWKIMIEYKAEFFFDQIQAFLFHTIGRGGKNVFPTIHHSAAPVLARRNYACEQIIRESMENPQHLYYIIVPEQFTMQTQKKRSRNAPRKGKS